MKFDFKSQRKMLDGCANGGIALADCLNQRKASYDSLVYADGATTAMLAQLPDFTPVDERPAVDVSRLCQQESK